MMSFEEKLLDDIFNSKFNFELHNKIGIHTFEIYVRMSKESFALIFRHLQMYVQNRIEDPYFRNLYMKFFMYVNLYSDHLTWGTTYIDVEPGVSIKLGLHDDFGHVHMIFNPALIVASRDKDFDSTTYDYTQITPHDFKRWNRFRELCVRILQRWHIPNCKMDKIKITRIDCCVNIEMGDVDIPVLLDYLRLVAKRNGYDVYKFYYKNHDRHHLLVHTKKQKLSIYDKCEEQHVKFGRNYGKNILRIEAQFEGSRIYDEFIKFADIRVNAIHKGLNIVDIVEEVARWSPLVIYDVIDMVFPDGDFLTRQDGIRILENSGIRESTLKRCVEFVDSFSRITTYDGIVNKIDQFKKNNSDSVYRRTMQIFSKNGIAPYWLKVNSRYIALPGLKSVYTSAIFNTIPEYSYIYELLDFMKSIYNNSHLL